MVSSRLTAGGLGGVLQRGNDVQAQQHSTGHIQRQQARRDVADTSVCHREHNREQRTHGDAEGQHPETHADVGLYSSGEPFEPLATVLVSAVCTLQCHMGGANAVLVSDRPFNHRFDKDPGEDERKHSSQGTGKQAAPDDLFFHCVDYSRAISGRGSRVGGGRHVRTRE